MGLRDEDVREILRLIDESDLDELRVETPSFSLYVRRTGGAVKAPAPAAAPPDSAEPPEVPPKETGRVTIVSPLLGIFYRAGAPGATPFVEVGARVLPETTVCIIEVMKMMNSIPAAVSGTVVEVCVENGTLVELGEPLFRVRPG